MDRFTHPLLEKTLSILMDEGDMVTKCSEGSWIGSWDRKEGLCKTEIQMKSIFSCKYCTSVNSLVLMNVVGIIQDIPIRASWM